jgi:hypothetical protein
MMGIPYNTKVPYKKLDECHHCGESFKKDETIKSGKVRQLKIYDDPWADEPSIIKVHAKNGDKYGITCLDKLTDASYGDFGYFECDECHRMIIVRCPFNGWRSYYHTSENGEQTCVKCIQDNRLINGDEKETFEKGDIPGEFYSESNIANHNWKLVPGMRRVYITGKASAAEFCKTALKLIGENHKVLVDYDALGIGSSEGYVSLYYK